MSGKRRIVKGIVTNGCDKKDYDKIYRQKTPEDRVKKAIELKKLDTEFYRRLIKTLKTDPNTRRILSFFWLMGFVGGIANFTIEIAVTSIIKYMI